MKNKAIAASTPVGATSPSSDESSHENDPAMTPERSERDADDKSGERKRRSRLFWKKKEIPGGLWLKCEGCAQTIYRKELEERDMVCPSCDYHFTLPGRERVAHLLDPDSFEERYAELETLDRLQFNDKVPYSEKVKRTVERVGQYEALICGRGTIQGLPVVIAVLDFAFLGGSMGEGVGEKIALAADLARTERLPLIIFTSSGGARMHEGMLSLMQMAKTSAALAALNEAGGLSICVMTNPTTGGVTASFASVCDLTLAEPGALIGFAGPRVIATTIKQELPPGFQRAEFLISKGQLDAIIHRNKLRSTLAQLIEFGRSAWDPDGLHPRVLAPSEPPETEGEEGATGAAADE